MTAPPTRLVLRVAIGPPRVALPLDHLLEAGFRCCAEAVPLGEVASRVTALRPDAILVEGAPPPNDLAALTAELARRGDRPPIVVVADLSPAGERALIDAGAVVVAPTRLECLGGILRRELAEAGTAGSDRAVRELAERLGAVSYEMDARSYAFTSVSRSAEALLGYPLADWYRPGFWTVHVHRDDVARADSFWLEAAAARRAHVVEYRMVAADGRVVWIQDHATPIDRPGGETAFLGLMIDVTRLREADQVVQWMNEVTAHHVGDSFFHTLVTGLGTALGVRCAIVAEISDLDPNRMQSVAAAADGRLLGPIELDLAVGPWGRVAHGEVHLVPTGVSEAFPDDPALRSLGATSFLGYPLLGADHQPIGVFAVLDARPLARTNQIDTVMSVFAARAGAELERRRGERQRQFLQMQLVQSQKMEAVGTLAGGIAHDFNNLLMGILGNAEIAREELSEGHPAQTNLNEILRAGLRARDVVQRILTFSRKREPQRQPVALRSVVDEAAALLRATLPATIEIRIERGEQSPLVLADPGQVHQVIMNLATNAAQAMAGRRGVLTFAESVVDVDRGLAETYVELTERRYVRLSIEDTGPGMTEEVLSRIFEPFFTTKAPGEGTGLGLAVVHGIVRDHDGAIMVRTRPNEGTGFDLYFPALAGAEAPIRPEPVPTPHGHGQRVLFIDDEPAIVRVGRRMLERLGYRVTACESAGQALAEFERAPEAFELVISDLTMPEHTGLEIAAKIRARNPAVKIVITTGNVNLLNRADRRAEIDEILPKPFATSRLAHIVNRLIGPPAERRSTAYFAYGANMDRDHMARTAPGAILLGRATLSDHRLAIARAGYATVQPSPGAAVHGVLWLLTAGDERRLDQFEGVPEGLYRKSTLTVVGEDDDEVNAMVYLAADARPGAAPRGYRDQICRAAALHDLPADYRESLDRLPISETAHWSGHPDVDPRRAS